MVFRIIIAGESQCEMFAQTCLVADYLSQNLPNFCYERIEKSVVEWEPWLSKINQKNMWHHCKSPLIWKELLMKGSKPYYIGAAPEFWDYCYSYYEFETYFPHQKLENLVENFMQFKKKVTKNEYLAIKREKDISDEDRGVEKNNFVVCISGAGYPLAMHLISGLLEMAVGEKNISKIYIYDEHCSEGFLEFVEHDCCFVETAHSTKVVKYVDRIGIALTHTDLLIALDHVPFDNDKSIGGWLHENRRLINGLAYKINCSASTKMRILLPNLGPACFNATVLGNLLTNVPKCNVAVATTDLGLEVSSIMAEIAEVPLKNMYCPPVWGFVGINHLVDIRTTVHKYCTLDPYTRYVKVKNSTLTVGTLTPEMRTMEYLMYWDETLWKRVAERKKLPKDVLEEQTALNKFQATLNVVKLWMFDQNPQNITTLGIYCDGSFGLKFKGVFSQPSRLENDVWIPAAGYMMPRDAQMKLPHLESIAELAMGLDRTALPKITPLNPCWCREKVYKRVIYYQRRQCPL